MKHKINMIINNKKNCFYHPLLLFESGPYIAWAPVNLSSKIKIIKFYIVAIELFNFKKKKVPKNDLSLSNKKSSIHFDKEIDI